MQIVLAIILVTIFGAVLYWVGASSPKKLIAMLRLEDLTLRKIMVLLQKYFSFIITHLVI